MVTILIISCVLAVIAFRFQQEVKKGYQYAGRKAAPVKTWMLPVPPLYKNILQKYFRYYQLLSPGDKSKFERKVCNFLYSKGLFRGTSGKLPSKQRSLLLLQPCS